MDCIDCETSLKIKRSREEESGINTIVGSLKCDLAVQDSTSQQAVNYIYSQPSVWKAGVHLFVKETTLCVNIPGFPSSYL